MRRVPWPAGPARVERSPGGDDTGVEAGRRVLEDRTLHPKGDDCGRRAGLLYSQPLANEVPARPRPDISGQRWAAAIHHLLPHQLTQQTLFFTHPLAQAARIAGRTVGGMGLKAKAPGVGQPGRHFHASMGPPPFGGGNITDTPPLWKASSTFNGATAFRWWKRR